MYQCLFFKKVMKSGVKLNRNKKLWCLLLRDFYQLLQKLYFLKWKWTLDYASTKSLKNLSVKFWQPEKKLVFLYKILYFILLAVNESVLRLNKVPFALNFYIFEHTPILDQNCKFIEKPPSAKQNMRSGAYRKLLYLQFFSNLPALYLYQALEKGFDVCETIDILKFEEDWNKSWTKFFSIGNPRQNIFAKVKN